jgi:anaerobic magnesium-protoporphyrin IX monomethyl ester cyclase
MKVLLINPNVKRKLGKSMRASPSLPPMGIAYISAVLRENGHEPLILDMNALNLQRSDLMKYIRENNPDIVGFSVTCPAIFKVFEMAESIKMKFPNIKIVLGGPHPTSLPLESMGRKPIDFVVLGEGEQTMLELVKELGGKQRFSRINGLVYRKNNKIIVNKERKRMQHLDELPFPAFDLLPLDKYLSGNSKNKKFTTILTSRGCPGRCIYCNKMIFGDSCNMRSAENIIDEIEFMKKKYGYTEFHIVDDLFTNNKQRVIDFCNLLIKKGLNIKWKCGNGIRVGTVDLSLLKLMKKSGCYSLSYGIESGNQKILNNIRKGQTLEQCRNAVKWTKQAGIDCVGFFMLGNLGENEETMQQTIDFAIELDVDIAQFMIMTPYPKTPIREIIEREGKIFESNWENYGQLAGKAVFEHGDLTREMMEKMYSRAYRKFYRRPGYILKRILRRRTLNEMKNEINGLLTLVEM